MGQLTAATSRDKVAGYERAAFGTGWVIPQGTGCDMRAIVIAHALQVSTEPRQPFRLGASNVPHKDTLHAGTSHALFIHPSNADPTPRLVPAASCELHAGKLYDPYSGTSIDFDPHERAKVEIDHIFPLAAAWDMGANAWTDSQRQEFANDPLNLIAVSRTQNQAKSDQLPAAWLPPSRDNRCWYVGRLAQVAVKYALPLADIAVMRRQCLPF